MLVQQEFSPETSFCMCENCGTQFRRRRGTSGKWCTRRCYLEQEAKRANKATCKHCGRPFSRSPARERGGFCSRKCAGKAKSTPENYKCQLCGGYKAWGADRSCRACFAKSQMKGCEEACANCGKAVYRSLAARNKTSRRHGVFCNYTCYGQYVRGQRSHSYIDGRQPGIYGNRWKAARRKVLERDGHVCFLCAAKPPTLDIHHINRDERNNEMWNLVALCRRCHNNQKGSLQKVTELAIRLCLMLNEKYGYQISFLTLKSKGITITSPIMS